MRVVIAGAGLGGLCLAHGLRGAGAEVVVVERNPTPRARPASYGIHLDADGLRALHSCLPEENWARLLETSTPAPDVVRFHDPDLHLLAERDHTAAPANNDPVTRRRAVSRDALRAALLVGCGSAADEFIRWGAPFERYDMDGAGVRVHCGDGGTITADLLVGADGANSRVRGRRLPGLQRQDLGIVNVAGRLSLTSDLERELPAAFLDGAVNNVVPATTGWMFFSTWEAQTTTPYLVWAWAARETTYPAGIGTADPVRLHDLVRERTADWARPLRRIVEDTDPATITAIPLKTMPRLPAWEPAAVTLLGDAIHNMTPMAGIGANTALRDAGTLHRQLAGRGDLLTRVGRYEDAMREYANRALALSTRNARSAATTARLPRHAFRTVLRLAEAVPPVKRRMFPAARH